MRFLTRDFEGDEPLQLVDRELDAMSGQWFLQKFRKSKRHRKTNKVISGNDLVKASVYGKEHPSKYSSSHTEAWGFAWYLGHSV